MVRVLALISCSLAVPAWASAPAAIPFKQEQAGMGQAIGMGSVGVLLVSLAAIAVVLYLRKRLKLDLPLQERGQGRVKVIESRRMGPRALLTVVEFGGRELLLVQSEHGVSCVAEAPLKAAE
jgi:flagellar biogenesis protein FliO